MQLIATFPAHWCHCMAVKANGLTACMRALAAVGISFESASLGELAQSIRCASRPERCVFDSPVKTRQELELALSNRVYLNLDNLQEVARVQELLAGGRFPAEQHIGLRLNPQVGLGKNPALSTAGKRSKFGIAMDDYTAEIWSAYEQNPWLNGVHCHVGSQGCPYELVLQGLQKIIAFADDLNQKIPGRIKYIDIGGGLPVNFESEEDAAGEAISFASWRGMLEEHCPQLFTGQYEVLTEYGRRLNSKSAFFISRVEYTKRAGPAHLASIHGGVELFTRNVYAPEKWPLRLSVFSDAGDYRTEEGDLLQQDIAGPCCIGGDLLAVDRWLPVISPGDHIVVHDTGGYVFSSFSYYNIRLAPQVLGYTHSDPMTFQVLRPAATLEETLKFFG